MPDKNIYPEFIDFIEVEGELVFENLGEPEFQILKIIMPFGKEE